MREDQSLSFHSPLDATIYIDFLCAHVRTHIMYYVHLIDSFFLFPSLALMLLLLPLFLHFTFPPLTIYTYCTERRRRCRLLSLDKSFFSRTMARIQFHTAINKTRAHWRFDRICTYIYTNTHKLDFMRQPLRSHNRQNTIRTSYESHCTRTRDIWRAAAVACICECSMWIDSENNKNKNKVYTVHTYAHRVANELRKRAQMR